MELSKIPKVNFFKKTATVLEFELLPLNKLFARKHKLAPPIDQPHRIQFHNILYITAGEGVHTIDFQAYPLSPGSMIFISQGQVHSFDMRGDIQGYLLMFTAEYLEKNLIHSDTSSLYRLYNYHLHTPVIHPQETEKEDFITIFNHIEKEYASTDSFAKDEILRLLLKVLLLKTERLKRTVIDAQKNAEWFIRFSHFQEQLERHYTSTRSVRDYAGMLSISPKHLNTVCRSVSGESAKQCIDNFVILEIKRGLATSSNSVQELSYEFGFDEPTNFVKYFKKRTGYSPSHFRKMFNK